MGNNSSSIFAPSSLNANGVNLSLSTTLPVATNLGKIRVAEDISVGDTTIFLDTKPVTIVAGMQLMIADVSVTILKVNLMKNWFSSMYSVIVDVPSPIYVEIGTYLTVLSPPKKNASFNSTSSGLYSNYSQSPSGKVTTSPTDQLTTTSTKPRVTAKPKPYYILHLPTATAANDILYIKPSLNVTSDDLNHISTQIVCINEPFTIEGLETSTPSTNSTTSTTSTTSGPSRRSKIVTCGPSSTNAAIDTNLSIFYMSDCLGYHVHYAYFKFDTLVMKLDSDDETLLYAGYYKLSI
jgi:hypothetical protein